MRVGYQEVKEFYVMWRDVNDIPKVLLAGPFDTKEQAIGALEALQPIETERRLTIVGGTLRLTPR